MKQRVIALITDFGLKDGYVGAMKGRMLSICPNLTFIDITHEVGQFSILSASYHIYSSWNYFPRGTVFLSVVDPGVGSSRKTLLLAADGRFLVTPDNGTISFTARMSGSFEAFYPPERLSARLFSESSPTFHGRDIFAPIAALIARNGFASVKGAESSPAILQEAYPVIDSTERTIIGRIIHIDRFGNCVSSIHETDLEEIGGFSQKRITFFGSTISKLHATYSEVSVGEEVAYIGSSGFLEIGVREGNASDATGLGIQDEILIG